MKAGAEDAIPASHWSEGGIGAIDLAKGVINASTKPKNFKLLYDTEKSIEEKMATIAREMYGADGIELSELSRKKIETYTRQVTLTLIIIIKEGHIANSACRVSLIFLSV